MTPETPEARLQDVLDTIYWAMLAPPAPGELAARMREVMGGQARLLEVLGQMRTDLEHAVGALQELPSEGVELRDAARVQMLRHFEADLAYMKGMQQTVEEMTDTLYAEFYTLL